MKTFLITSLAVPLCCGAATFVENFSAAPTNWATHGDSSLFSWSTNSHALDVTWDSRRPNSYFYHELGTVLTRYDDFRFEFDLMLHDIAIGLTPGRPYTFEVALGLIHLRSASNTNFFRGQFGSAHNLVEFDYFPAFSSFGATVAATIVSSNNSFAYSHNFPLEMPLADLFRIRMDYTASSSSLTIAMTRNGELFGPLEEARLGPTFSDFRVDAFAICSYSDERADGSILAHGSVDNITIVFPDPPLIQLTGRFATNTFEAQFFSQTNWQYQLLHSLDFSSWNPVTALVPGNGTNLKLVHQPMQLHGFYRVRAERP